MKAMTMKLTPIALAASAAICVDVIAADAPDPQLIQKGQYIALAGDCIACHSSADGPPYAGGTPFPALGQSLSSANITPDKKTGIGSYSYEDFDQAVRYGVGKGDRALYPTMPYYTYARVTEEDMRAMYAFFMHGLEPVSKAIEEPSTREPAEQWRQQHAQPVGDFAPAAGQDPAIARGAYLVEVLGHCGYCHTPYGDDMVLKALTPADGDEFLSGGGPLETWLAKNLRSDYRTGIGNWSEQDLFDFLRTGRNQQGAAFGIMAEIVHLSLQHLNDEDTTAIARYLKALPAKDPEDKPQPYDETIAKALFSGDDSKTGAAIYIDNCAACHRTDGHGYAPAFPPLANNAVMNTDNATALIHIVLTGGTLPAMKEAPSSITMPPFGWRLNDQQVADVVTFIRSGWGNTGPAVSADDVAQLRKTLAGMGTSFGSENVPPPLK